MPGTDILFLFLFLSLFSLQRLMSPPISSSHSESGTARFLGSASSGILELIIFHPVDTVAKRLMSNQNKASNKNQAMQQNILTVDYSFGNLIVRLQRIRLLSIKLFSR